MYKVKYCEKNSFFEELGQEKEVLVSKSELVELLNNAKVLVVEARYVQG